MKIITTLVVLLCIGSASAQNKPYPSIKKIGNKISEFVPKNWIIIDSISGDLNRDRLPDVAVVLELKSDTGLYDRKTDSSDAILPKKRIIFILFKEPKSPLYRLAEQSNSFIISSESSTQEEPFQELNIEHGILEIKFLIFYNAGSWTVTNATYSFTFRNNQFVLAQAELYSINRSNQDYTDYQIDFLTHSLISDKGNNNSDTNPVIEETKLSPMELRTLKTFEKPFTWEIIKDFFI